jgi:hypothetical protein
MGSADAFPANCRVECSSAPFVRALVRRPSSWMDELGALDPSRGEMNRLVEEI